jgi:hypothetical protein
LCFTLHSVVDYGNHASLQYRPSPRYGKYARDLEMCRRKLFAHTYVAAITLIRHRDPSHRGSQPEQPRKIRVFHRFLADTISLNGGDTPSLRQIPPENHPFVDISFYLLLVTHTSSLSTFSGQQKTPAFAEVFGRAGDEIRTRDIFLGKEAFYR